MAWANTGIDRKSLDPILRGWLQCFSPMEAKGCSRS
jgi:hypothetical protein